MNPFFASLLGYVGLGKGLPDVLRAKGHDRWNRGGRGSKGGVIKPGFYSKPAYRAHMKWLKERGEVE